MICPQCGLGPDVAHGRMACYWRHVHECARQNGVSVKHVLRSRRYEAEIDDTARIRHDIERFEWWCVRNAWRFGLEAQGLARNARGKQYLLHRMRNQTGASPSWRATVDINRYASARYAQACAEIVRGNE